MHTNLSTNRRK